MQGFAPISSTRATLRIDPQHVAIYPGCLTQCCVVTPQRIIMIIDVVICHHHILKRRGALVFAPHVGQPHVPPRVITGPTARSVVQESLFIVSVVVLNMGSCPMIFTSSRNVAMLSNMALERIDVATRH